MVSRNRKLRLFLLIVLAGAIAVTVSIVRLNRRAHISEVFTTQRPGEPKRVWHTMEKLWECGLFHKGTPNRIDTIESNAAAIFAVAGKTLARIDKSSGDVVWTRELAASGTSDSVGGSSDASWQWQITVLRDRLLVSQVENPYSSAQTTRNAALLCVRAADGSVLWSRNTDVPIASQPPCADFRALVPLETGEVLCLDLNAGAIIWRRQISSTHYTPGSKERCPALLLAADADACVVRAGASHFLGLNAATGDVVWSKTTGSSTADAENRKDDTPFTLDKGTVYISPSSSELLAWNGATGMPAWDRTFERSPSDSSGSVYDPPIVGRDIVIAQCGSGLAGVRRTDGSPLWSGCRDRSAGGDQYDRVFVDQKITGDNTFYVFDRTDIVVSGQQRPRRIGQAYDIVAIDAGTGNERWRWQNDLFDSNYYHAPIEDHGRLFVNADDRVIALQPGPEESLPFTAGGRVELAYRMVQDLYGWSPKDDSVMGRLRRRFPRFFPSRDGQVGASKVHARLMLLRLRADAVGAMEDVVHHFVSEIDNPTTPVFMFDDQRPDRQIIEPLDILFDLRAYSAIPNLIAELQRSKTPEVRRDIAELMIRLNGQIAMPALFLYAKTCTDLESNAGAETLWYLCRYAPQAPSKDDPTVTQDILTSYLIAKFKDPASPVWIRRFAQFELIRGRGDAARRLALAAIPHGARSHVMPTLSEVTDGANYNPASGRTAPRFAPDKTVKDAAGRWWGVFNSRYFGQTDVWVVQSADGKDWSNPTVAVPSEWSIPVSLKLTSPHGHTDASLVITLDPGGGGLIRTASVSIDSLYRDTDGDRIPDIVEREIGTNPLSADTMHSGMKDGENKNPTYAPHRLTRNEQIYAAVLEAICTYASILPQPDLGPQTSAGPVPVTAGRPLFVAAGPSGLGVPVYSHLHPVFMYSHAYDTSTGRSNQSDVQFCKPMAGLNPELEPGYKQFDVNFNREAYEPSRFKEWFKSIASADGKRVRVGVRCDWATFDVEVDEIGGKWLPVECRCVSEHWMRSGWDAAIPEHDAAAPPTR